jgi:hypothetical protein
MIAIDKAPHFTRCFVSQRSAARPKSSLEKELENVVNVAYNYHGAALRLTA